MVNPVKYHLDTKNGDRLINIEPVYEEITGGDLFPTGRYLLTDAAGGNGEIRFYGDIFDWEWNGDVQLEPENLSKIARFIVEYEEPELAGHLD